MLKTIFYIFYFVKGCGSFGLNSLFGNSFRNSWSIFVRFLYRFYHLFRKFWIPGSRTFLLFLPKIRILWKAFPRFKLLRFVQQLSFRSEKSHSMLNSFKTCKAVPFDRSLVFKTIVLICKEIFRTLFVSLLKEMLLSS